MKMTLMSYNTEHCLNYITRRIDFDAIADAIRQCGADVIGLNEMRDTGRDEDYQAQVKILAEKLGFHYYFAKAIEFDGCNPYGNGLLSRYPILNAETVMVPDPEVQAYDDYYETRCLLKAELDVPGGLTVCVIHFGLNPDEHENAMKVVQSQICDERCVLMGDFNIRPENPLLDPLRERLYDTADSFDEYLLSFPSDAPDRRIDYIFTSKDLKVLSADIPDIREADHRPYVAAIEC